jgi:glutaredoxin 3
MVTIYGAVWCGPCQNAKLLCETKGIEYTFIDIQQDKDAQDMFTEKGFKTVPQIFIDEEHIGGYDDLVKRGL